MEATVGYEGAAGNPRNGDEKLRVEFYKGTMHNPLKSKEAGRPIFDDKDFIRIRIPGDKNNVIDTLVWDDENNPDSHTSRFRAKWLAYKAGADTVEAGLPLKEWPQVTRGQVEELGFFNVKTVEQLAGCSDSALQRFPGGFALRQKAQDFLLSAATSAPMEKMRSELEARDAQLAAQQAQLTELSAALVKLQQAQAQTEKHKR